MWHEFTRISAQRHYDRPLLIGTVARELTTQELLTAYYHRSPVETNFFVADGHSRQVNAQSLD